MRTIPSLVLTLLLATAGASASDLTHFTDCAQLTGRNATIIIPAGAHPQVGGVYLAPGDEIAAYTPDGSCGGAAVWSGTTLAISVWEQDILDPSGLGFEHGAPLAFRAYQASTGTEFGIDPAGATVEFDPTYESTGVFESDAIYVVASMDFPTSSEEPSDTQFELRQPFPNPFTTTTTLRYSIPSRERVRLEVYDMLGRRVAMLLDEYQSPGTYEHRFSPDATVAPGLYVARLRTDSATTAVRMMLVR